MQRRDTSVPASDGSVKTGSGTSSASDRHCEQVDHLASYATSGTKQENDELLTKKVDAWNRHEQLIADLLKHLEGRRNVNNVRHTLAKNLAGSLKRMRQLDEQVVRPLAPRPTVNGTAQTSPSLNRMDSEAAEWSPAPTPEARNSQKKRKERTPSSAEAKKAKRSKQRDDLAGAQSTYETDGDRVPDWEEVRKKVRKKKKKKKPTKQRAASTTLSNALMIRAKEGKSYADILRKVRQGIPDDQIGDSIQRVCRTNTGQLLIVLDKKSSAKTDELRKLMADALKEEAEVSSKTQVVDLEIRDIEEIATKREVADALQKAAGEDCEIPVDAVKSLRRAYGETQIASVRLPAGTARKIVGEEGKIRIRCRIREVRTPIKFFKCWNFGHLSSRCKSEVDRSKHCIECGEDGHKIAECTKDARCVLCTNDGKEASCDHVAGSRRCAAFKEALQALTSKRR